MEFQSQISGGLGHIRIKMKRSPFQGVIFYVLHERQSIDPYSFTDTIMVDSESSIPCKSFPFNLVVIWVQNH